VIARPGSSLWLLRHEIRMFWYSSAASGKKGKTTRRMDKLSIGTWAAVWFVLHMLAFVLLRDLDEPAGPRLAMVVTGILAVALTFMLSKGIASSVEVLFQRGDLDLLLSSPLSSHSIFTVRLAGMVVGIAGLYLFFLAPVAHVGLLLGQFQWLGIYPAILGSAVVSASLAMLVTLGLVRTLGARRTRVVAQVIGALAGALIYLLSQLYSLTVSNGENAAAGWLAQLLAPGAYFGSDSWVWWPGRAALGDPQPLFWLSVAAVAVFVVTVRFAHRFFVHGLQQAASTVRAARPGALKYRFGRSVAEVVVIKEWRLIARDPHLISQVLLQMLYMLPLVVVLFREGASSLPGIGAGLTLLSASLSAALSWIIITAEDAPDLLLCSPCSARAIQYAKLAAAIMPPLALTALPLLWILLRNPLVGLLMSFTVAAAVVSSALIVLWRGRQHARGEFKTRSKGNFLSTLLETLSAFAWSGLSYLLIGTGPTPSGAMSLEASLVFVAALAMPAFAWLTRRRQA
jgi:ABC-2 type transport system permease protein